MERPAARTVQHTNYDCCSRSGRVASAWTCVLNAASASRLKLLACGGDGFIGQTEMPADVVDGGLTSLHLAHVRLIFSLGDVSTVSKAEAVVDSVDDAGVLGQPERRDCPGGK